jgi:hypothetical protein
MKNCFLVTLLVAVGLSISCTNKQTPENALQEFVTYSFTENQKKEFYLDRTTGAFKELLRTMTDEEMAKFFNVKDLQKNKFKITLEKCSDKQCFLTYTLYYKVNDGAKPEYEVEVKKIAEMQKDSDTWKVANIENIKTYIDSRNPIVP